MGKQDKKKWSKYQQNIFDFCENGKGSAIIQAVAGSGKTTTLIEAFKRMNGKAIFLAFNKSIATELSERGVNAKTFHGLCFMYATKFKSRVDMDKLHKIIKQHLNNEQQRAYASPMKRLISLGKQSGVGIMCDAKEFRRLFIDHEMELDSVNGNIEEFFKLTEKIFDYSVRDRITIDFDDMLYNVVKDQTLLEKYDNVFVDEAQDTNAIQREILKLIMKPKSRVIACGDVFQAIYRFRGADSNSMQLIKETFKCKELPLSITYRCPKKVVEYAQMYNSEIQAAPSAVDGEVLRVDGMWKIEDFEKQHLVLCRVTRPIISLAYKLLNQKIPVTVLGRDIGVGLKALIKKCNLNDDISLLVQNLEIYRNKECTKLMDEGKESRVAAINDKVDTVLALIESLPMDQQNVQCLNDVIDQLFAEKRNAVIFSTIHKAKGLEADHVWWLNYHDCPAKWATHPADQQQERNLCYVAITRAKKTLRLIKERG